MRKTICYQYWKETLREGKLDSDADSKITSFLEYFLEAQIFCRVAQKKILSFFGYSFYLITPNISLTILLHHYDLVTAFNGTSMKIRKHLECWRGRCFPAVSFPFPRPGVTVTHRKMLARYVQFIFCRFFTNHTGDLLRVE